MLLRTSNLVVGGDSQVVENLRRQLCVLLDITRLRLEFGGNTLAALMKKCRRREGGEKGRRGGGTVTKLEGV